MSKEDLEFEPIRGLPDYLPEGEHILWQGAPKWQALTRRMFKARALAAYFGVLLLWGVVTALYDGRGALAAGTSALTVAGLAAAAIGILAGYAWLVERTTVYTITTRRLVFRIGVALPLTINLPFRQIQAAQVKTYPDGTGDLPLPLSEDNRLAYLHLWPHARPWRLARAEPMLRCIPEAATVAEILSEALAAASVERRAEDPVQDNVAQERPAPRPATNAPAANEQAAHTMAARVASAR